MRDGSNYLDPDRPGAVRLSVGAARALDSSATGSRAGLIDILQALPTGPGAISMAIIQFHAITNVRILARAWAAIAGRDHRNLEIDVAFMTKDVRQIAPQLLHCAAIEAGPRPKPLPGTVIPGCDLPVIGWRTGRSNVNGEPILEIDVSRGTTLRFQFPASTAKDCGTALAAEGMAAGPASA